MLRRFFWVTLGLFLVVGAFWTRNILSASENSTARITFLGDQPAWAQDAESIMTELETWRGQSFQNPLEIQIKPKAEGEPAGWYSPETRQLVVTTDGSDNFKRGVMLHEIFHALQDQNFDLLSLHQSVTNADADQALDALIEGEAMLAVSELLNYNFSDHAQLPETGEISDAFFNRLFEYGDGMNFVRSLRETGGWTQVNDAFRTPPRSTHEIYHPEVYPLPPSKGPISSSPLGEYGFRLWLARAPESRAKLKTLGEAYKTDSLQVSQEGTHTWRIQLKTPEAVQLTQAIAPNAMAKIPNAPQSFDLVTDETEIQLTWKPSLTQQTPQSDR